MKFLTKIQLSKWWFLFFIIWIIVFITLGIESGEGSQPTEDSSPLLDTIYIISSPFVLGFLYYYLYRRVNKWIVFLSAPFIGMLMEWFLFRPADVLNESTTVEALWFFAWIWTVILIPPYFLTRIADRSKKHLLGVIAFVVVCFAAAIVNLVIGF